MRAVKSECLFYYKEPFLWAYRKSVSVYLKKKKEIRSPHLFLHSDLPIKQDEYFNHRRPLRKRYLMKTSLACTPYSACLQQWMLRFKAVSAWWLYGMSEDSAFLPLLPRQTAQRSDKPPPSPVPQTARDGLVFHSLSVHLRLTVPWSVFLRWFWASWAKACTQQPSSIQSTTIALCHCFSHVWPKQVT